MYEFKIDPALFERLMSAIQYWQTLNQGIIIKYPNKETGLSFRRGQLFCYVEGVETPIDRTLIVANQRAQLERMIAKLFMRDFETGNYDLLG